MKRPLGGHGEKTDPFLPLGCAPSPPKRGRRFGFAENGDSRVSCFTAPKGAYDILRTNQNVTEGVRLLLLAKRKCCAFCKNTAEEIGFITV